MAEWVVVSIGLVLLAVLVSVLLLTVQRRRHRTVVQPGNPGRPGGGVGDREPRNPRPFAGSGAAAVSREGSGDDG